MTARGGHDSRQDQSLEKSIKIRLSLGRNHEHPVPRKVATGNIIDATQET